MIYVSPTAFSAQCDGPGCWAAHRQVLFGGPGHPAHPVGDGDRMEAARAWYRGLGWEILPSPDGVDALDPARDYAYCPTCAANANLAPDPVVRDEFWQRPETGIFIDPAFSRLRVNWNNEQSTVRTIRNVEIE
jgi:hypothetical protein